MIHDCSPDPARLAPFEACCDAYGMDDLDPASEWPWNVLSKRTVVFSCGAFARSGERFEHSHDPDEAARCARLAARAAEIMGGVEVGMGSEASTRFSPFFVVANVAAEVPRSDRIDVACVQAAFGGTLHPDADVDVEPLREEGSWWRAVLDDHDGVRDLADQLAPWRALMAWFGAAPEFVDRAFVSIGGDPDEASYTAFPRLAVGLTGAGSLVGISGWAVLT